MTAIITQSTDSLLDSTNNTLTQLSVPPLENLTKSIADTLPVLKPSTLLIKRHSSYNLDDLVVKKIKTQSTTCSDSESLFHTTLSNKRTNSKTFPSLTRSGSIESVEKDDGFMLEEDFSTEGLTLIDQASKGLFSIPPLEIVNPLDNLKMNEALIPSLELGVHSLNSLHQSLEILKNQLMINQFKDLLIQSIFPVNQGENTLRIPPFVEQNEAQIRVPFQEKVSKRLPKKIEEEMEISYGDVEFPFLSIAAQNESNITGPLLQVNQNILSDKSNDLMPKKRKYTKLNPVFKIHKNSQENERKENKANKKEKKVIKGEKIAKKVIFEDKEIKEKKPQTKKPSPVKIITNANQNTQVQKFNKKSIKEEAKSPMEIEEPTQGTKERKSFLSFHFQRRRGEERKKNRWQVSQDIKLGDLQIPTLNLTNNFAIMFEGNKKKSSQIPIGSEFQVDIDLSITKSKGSNKRQPKLKWDPSAQKESDVLRLFKEVENITDVETNQEKIIKYLAKNKGDIKKTKKYIKDNKSKVSQDLIIKALE